jgi:hypothetical protein
LRRAFHVQHHRIAGDLTPDPVLRVHVSPNSRVM